MKKEKFMKLEEKFYRIVLILFLIIGFTILTISTIAVAKLAHLLITNI